MNGRPLLCLTLWQLCYYCLHKRHSGRAAVMKRLKQTLTAAGLACLLPAAQGAGKFSWFDEMPARDSLGLVRTPLLLLEKDTRVTFGVGAFESLASNPLVDGLEAHEVTYPGDGLRLYGEIDRKADLLYAPLANIDRVGGHAPGLFESHSNRLAGFGVNWQHRLDASNSLALSAGYSESAWEYRPALNLDVYDTRAALSWTSIGSGSFRPGFTGSVFVGDENVRDEAYQRLGRRYYGFSVGGQVTVFQEHTPYLFFRHRRNFESAFDDPATLLYGEEERSLLSAGWRWEVQPNWSLQAEAIYGLGGSAVDPYAPDRSRFFFGTRFDFR